MYNLNLSLTKLHDSSIAILFLLMPAHFFSFVPLKLTMDSGKALDNDGTSSQVTWLEGSVLSAGPFSIVLVSNHHPAFSICLDYTVKTKDKCKLLSG